ncbi:MAG: class I SAM-dependent methyltransferase [Anaerolineae bacterium]|nr:class I SAM-dependent methyltransferase [Anaerolineae bacterium]
MQGSSDELALYHRARQRLRKALVGRLPGDVDLEGILTSYAYWVCTAVSKRGADWEATLRDYTDVALRRAADEGEAERREVALLRRELARARGPVLDVGAGWGRLAPLYDELGLRAVYVEPATLGTQLMRRDGLSQVVRCVGEALPFADGTFPIMVIGWVLHHESSDLDAVGIVRQIGRVTAPGGTLLSVEPLGAGFDQEKWTGLLTQAGFEVDGVERFFETQTSRGEIEHHALAVGTRRARCGSGLA